MSSYVAVAGIPSGNTCSIFGLTPQEVRYLQVRSEEFINPNLTGFSYRGKSINQSKKQNHYLTLGILKKHMSPS